jgi:hypothetical protein
LTNYNNQNQFNFDKLLINAPTSQLPFEVLPELSALNSLFGVDDFTVSLSLDHSQTQDAFSLDALNGSAPVAQFFSASGQIFAAPAQQFVSGPVFSAPFAAAQPFCVLEQAPEKKYKQTDDRRKRNTESAKRSRIKKLEKVQDLESRLLESENKRKELERLLKEAQLALSMRN